MWFPFEPRAEDLTSVRMVILVPGSTPDIREMQARWEKNHAITPAALMEDFALGEEIRSGVAS